MQHADRMIEAYKHGWPHFAVESMIDRRARTSFRAIRVQGLADLRGALDDDPRGFVMVANHSCWWDVFITVIMNKAISVDGYGMMEHFNLKRFGFFRRIGAFSVDRTDPLAVRASIDYTLGLLRRPRACVWIFPQGRMTGNDVRPLGFQPGLRALLRRGGSLRIVTAALRYEFWQDERPEAFVRLGLPLHVDRGDVPTVLHMVEDQLTSELDALNRDVTLQAADRFVTILKGRESISDRFARLHARFFGATPNAPEIPESPR